MTPETNSAMRSEGLTYDQHAWARVHRTLARTVSETDIVTFVNLCGFTEPLFMDMEYVATGVASSVAAPPRARSPSPSPRGSSCRPA